MKPFKLALVSLVVLAACSDSIGVSPAVPGDPTAEVARGATRITVMTRNLYVGADVDQVIGALVSPDPTDDLPTLLGAIATLAETDFPTRATALADEIARNRPHAVGLQEVSTIDIDLGPLGIPIVVKQDFLPTLLAALAARGLDYQAVVSVTNIQAAPLPGVSLTDRDVLLVDRSRVKVGGTPTGRTYAANIGQVAPGVLLVRGYVIANLVIDGRPVTVASTHLESGNAPGFDLLRAGQATELATRLAGDGPVVILGDLNDFPGSPMYGVLAGAGYADLWTTFRREGEGYTCCHVANLGNERSALSQRIDYVWARGGVQATIDGNISLVGNRPQNRVAGPAHLIWPSDHAGVVAKVVFAPSAIATR